MIQTLMNTSVAMFAVVMTLAALSDTAKGVGGIYTSFDDDDNYVNDYVGGSIVRSLTGMYIGIVCAVLFCCVGLPILIFCMFFKADQDARNNRAMQNANTMPAAI